MYNLRIDTKYNRLYLGNPVIEDLGNPEFIQMWIRPSDMAIVFAGTGFGQRVRRNSSGEFCLYSKRLVTDIKNKCGSRIKGNSSYRLRGEKVDNGICFLMSTMEKISDTTEDKIIREVENQGIADVGGSQ